MLPLKWKYKERKFLSLHVAKKEEDEEIFMYDKDVERKKGNKWKKKSCKKKKINHL